MRDSRVFGFIGSFGLMAWVGWSQPASAQSPTPAETAAPSPFGKCNPLHDQVPPKQNEADGFNPEDLIPSGIIPAQALELKRRLLMLGLPCVELVSPTGPDGRSRLENFQRGFDFYSWLTFIALSAPDADPHDITMSKPETRTVWEDPNNFIPLLDVMLPGGAKPDWDPKNRVVPPACRVEHEADKSLMVIKMIEESFNQPFKTGPLIDQNNNYTIFDILMNKAMFKFIIDQNLYSREGQSSEANSNLRIDFPPGVGDDKDKPGTHGSIMIKVSWKILGPEDDKNKFHHVEALVALPATETQQIDPPCLRKTLGLVGIHIVHKTKNRPQWIWTSFEHVNNVPERSQIEAFRNDPDPNKKAPKFNFYTLSCSDHNCPVNQTPPPPWDPEPENGLQFRRNDKGQMLFNSQIVRKVPLTKATHAINRQFHAVLGDSVWTNYILIGTQWPSDFDCATRHSTLNDPEPLPPKTDFDKQPDMNCVPAPTFLANSTLETYSQGEIPLSSSSCMACHGNATSYLRRSPGAKETKDPHAVNDAEMRRRMFMNQSDFTFILEKAR